MMPLLDRRLLQNSIDRFKEATKGKEWEDLAKEQEASDKIKSEKAGIALDKAIAEKEAKAKAGKP